MSSKHDMIIVLALVEMIVQKAVNGLGLETLPFFG